MDKRTIMKLIPIFLIVIVAIAAILTYYMTFIYMHEYAHKQIYEGYGISSEIVMWNKDDFTLHYVIPKNPCPDEYCNLANRINDDIGYNIEGIYGLIIVFGLGIMAFQYLQLQQLNRCSYKMEGEK